MDRTRERADERAWRGVLLSRARACARARCVERVVVGVRARVRVRVRGARAKARTRNGQTRAARDGARRTVRAATGSGSSSIVSGSWARGR